MKTITQLETDLADLGKPLCRRQVYHYLKTLNLKPVGPGKPHLYPDDTSAKLAAYLGLKTDCATVLPLAEIKRRAEKATVRKFAHLYRGRKGGAK